MKEKGISDIVTEWEQVTVSEISLSSKFNFCFIDLVRPWLVRLLA